MYVKLHGLRFLTLNTCKMFFSSVGGKHLHRNSAYTEILILEIIDL